VWTLEVTLQVLLCREATIETWKPHHVNEYAILWNFVLSLAACVNHPLLATPDADPMQCYENQTVSKAGARSGFTALAIRFGSFRARFGVTLLSHWKMLPQSQQT
jgi:hypothetical protein